jgi:hypothetical protein
LQPEGGRAIDEGLADGLGVLRGRRRRRRRRIRGIKGRRRG